MSDHALSQRRVAEWLAITLLVLLLIGTFVHYTHYVRGQAELAALKTTVGALRTALVVEHLRQQVTGTVPARTVTPVVPNPFDLVGQQPANYVGVVQRQAAASVAPGSWVFDPQCPCVGYRPSDSQWFDTPVDDAWLWFQLTGLPGALQLVTKEKYRWNNELVN